MLRRLHQLPKSAAAPLYPCAARLRLGWPATARWARTWGDGGGNASRSFSTPPPRRQELETHPAAAFVPAASAPHEAAAGTKHLPAVCPGCGAHSQTVEPESAGFYSAKRTRGAQVKDSRAQEDAIFRAALANGSLPPATAPAHAPPPAPPSTAVPICDRCHALLYHSRGTPIVHPSMHSLQQIIQDSPHAHNHIYHVLDAADFPLSLIPNLAHALALPPLRSRNRRAKTTRYAHGRVAEVSFVITRADLLAPRKEQVDALFPWVQEVLRDALGRTGRGVRLGGVRCVSAKRGWWTKEVKEAVWERGGAGWMVGKANVGKSALFEGVFPKGRTKGVVKQAKAEEGGDVLATGEVDEMRDALSSPDEPNPLDSEPSPTSPLPDPFDFPLPNDHDQDQEQEHPPPLDESPTASLLPPAQPPPPFPPMPLVSALPGTTASPIRHAFGHAAHAGELIDLPGTPRSNLAAHVRPDFHRALVMTSRVAPEQYTIRPGQSLLLGGLIRISHTSTSPSTSTSTSPSTSTNDDDPVILAYPFLPPEAFAPHVTGTHKAIAIQTGIHSALSLSLEGQPYTGTVPTITTEAAKSRVKSAGTFLLSDEVTKRQAGALTDPQAGKRRVADLPFAIYSTDILIESVGWVELICQVRRRRGLELGDGGDDGHTGPGFPAVEIFSPEGLFVGQRKSMGGFRLGGQKVVPVWKRRVRPRMSISMTKRRG
ncbi:hypothetical protein LTR08_003703 [Meristemomyces frigidus]|nr:hypothetical protein LTR08_003703 [Meristemomyces frigidus]